MPGSTASAQTVLTPKASILVDADTGVVLAGTNTREPLPPASMTKLITALAAVSALEPGASIPVSARAAGMPAHNLNMKEGQVWVVEDVLASLLLSSANDAGMALAEAVSGTAEAFGDALAATADRLGMSDNPVLQDPSGLDDEFSIGGGNRVSARDLAIAARAVLAEPRLASLTSSKVQSFTGGDGIAHRLGNHNKLLTLYPGAVGMKTGYTKRAMHGLAGAATRNGRTMIAIVIGLPGTTYGPVTAMLDAGFASAPGAAGTGDRLPQVAGRSSAVARTAKAAASPAPVVAEQALNATPASSSGSSLPGPIVFLFKLILGFVAVVAILRIRVKANERSRRHIRTRQKTYRVPPPAHHRPAMPRMAPAVAGPPMMAAPMRTNVTGPNPVSPAPTAPRRPRPLTAQRTRPARSAPVRRPRPETVEAEPHPVVDPKLARRFEILVRTGQVVP